MKIFLIIAGIIAFSCAHSIPSTQGESRIINGANAELGEIPYQVSLQEKYDDFHFCGGSILNSKYVLTAAHCVVSKSVSLVQVIAATVNLMEPLSTYNAKEIIVHSEYDALDSWRNDIALIEIEGEFITTALLNYVRLANANQKIPAESPAIVSGWGRTSVGGSSPMHLQKAQIYIVEQEVCKNIYNGVLESIHETHICARDPNTQTGACNGDSGGPLTVDGQQVGIVSWSYSCALKTHPTVYTRVSQYRDWIEANTKYFKLQRDPRIIVKIFFLLSGLVALAQGGLIPSPLGSIRIINGVDSKPGEIPYQVSLQFANYFYHFCGGSVIQEGGQSPLKLKKAEILIADQAYCQERYKSLSYDVYSSHICAHDPVQMTGSCHGDSGGPLTVNGKLVGLVSWAFGCANTEYPTVYTRVPEFHDWIKSNAV